MTIDCLDYCVFQDNFGVDEPFQPRRSHKKIVRSVTRVVKKVVSSPIGKIALAAAGLYTGGAALGLVGGTGLSSGALSLASQGSLFSASSFATSAASAVTAGSFAKTALSTLSAINNLGAGEKEQAINDYGSVIAAQRRAEAQQAENLKTQEALTAQQRNDADKQEEEVSASLAAQKNAVLARRRGRGGLAFSGPNTGLNTTFGG